MVTRRSVLTTTIGAAGLAAEAGIADAQAAAAPINNILAKGAEIMRGGPLMNLPRAYRVMEEENLDGLVLAHQTNVYHLTGYRDHMSIRQDAPASIVLLSRDPRQAPGIVTSQFLYYYSFSDAPTEFPPQTFLYTGWDGPIADRVAATRLPDDKVKAAAPRIFDDMHLYPITAMEERRLARLKAALTRPMATSAQRALAKAAREMGLDRGRIGYDHPVVAGSYEMAGLPAAMVYADRPIRRIRMIKSPREIELMRLTARANAEAAVAAAQSARAGASHRQLRETFWAECAKRGTSGLLMQIDSVIPETYEGTFKEGTSFLIDCVSLGFQYFGDFGRTVFVGEPSRSMKRATDCISFGWDAVREHLRPGITYREISRLGTEALKKAGYDYRVPFTPHSVGLAHTDEPGVGDSSAFWEKDNLTLEENMIISVDCPIVQTGIGGSAHLEDLSLITKDGAVQINDIGGRTLIV